MVGDTLFEKNAGTRKNFNRKVSLLYGGAIVKVDEYLTISSWYDEEDGERVIDMSFKDGRHRCDRDLSFIGNGLSLERLEERLREEHELFLKLLEMSEKAVS